MAQLTINIGAAPNDGTGDSARQAGAKINSNFSELYDRVSEIELNGGGNGGGGGGGGGNGSVISVGISGNNGIVVDGSPIDDEGIISLSINAAQLRSHLNVADGATNNVGTVTSVVVTGADGITVTNGSISSTGTIGLSVDAAALRTHLNVANGATANATDAQLRDRSTHTGAQAISTVTGLQAAIDNALVRANHTGTQAIITITGLQTALDAKLTASLLEESIANNLSNPVDEEIVTVQGTGLASLPQEEVDNNTVWDYLIGSEGLADTPALMKALSTEREIVKTVDGSTDVVRINWATSSSPNRSLVTYGSIAQAVEVEFETPAAEILAIARPISGSHVFVNTSGTARAVTLAVAETGTMTQEFQNNAGALATVPANGALELGWRMCLRTGPSGGRKILWSFITDSV